jgi:lysophospholipase L1-like esterase
MTVGLVLAGAALVAVIVAEGTARWWIRHRSRYYVWTPRTTVENRMAAEVFPELETRARLEINADGERGGDVPRDQPGLFRILAAGGSAVECFALDQPKTWTGLLERQLNEPDNLRVLGAKQVHVGNVGHSGVGSAELDVILERLLPQYRRLDVILIMVGASDVYHWLEEGAQPSQPPPSVPEAALFAWHPAKRFGWKPARWALAELALRLHRSVFGRHQVKERAGAWFAAARRMRAEATEVRTTMPDPSRLVSHFEHHFRRAVSRAQAHADHVLVLRQPWFEKDYTAEERARFWHGGAGKPWKEKVTTYFDLGLINRLLGLVDARVVQVADALGVPHVELLPLLNGGVRHYYDHDHYTAAGAAIVASAVAAALIRGRTSPESPPRVPSARPTAAPSTSGTW